jgi:hypothetical protein
MRRRAYYWPDPTAKSDIFALILHCACINSPPHTASLLQTICSQYELKWSGTGGFGMTTTDGDRAGDRTSGAASASRDSFLWRYPLSVVACVMALATLSYLERFDGFWSFVSGLLLFLTLVLYGLVLLFLGIVALFRARVKGALAFVLGPVAVVLLFVLDVQWILRVPLDLLQFYYHRGGYDAAIDKMSPEERASTVVFFDWGNEGGAMASLVFYWLVYDESGEIALSDSERTQAWKDRVYPKRGEVDGAQCRTAVYRLSGHYYSVTAACE